MKIINKTATEFFEDKYLDYAKYVISNRAMPSIIDGLKPGARKIMHAALKVLNEKREDKFIDLVGSTLRASKYDHGDASLIKTIIGMSSEYKDNLHPLRVIGSGGDLRNPAHAAPRYLSIQLSNFAKIFEQDSEILEYNYDGTYKIEPTYYLPLIPLTLTKRTTGIGLGYKFNSSVSYNPHDLIKACEEVIKHGRVKNKNLTPWINQYSGTYGVDEEGRITTEATYQLSKDKIKILELTPGETFESYKTHLNSLLESGKILDWTSGKDANKRIFYEVKMNASELTKMKEAKEGSRNHYVKVFKLLETFQKNTLTYLDENRDVLIFDDVIKVIEYFAKFRLKKYGTLKESKIKNIEENIIKTNELKKFIDLFLTDKIKLNPKTPIEVTKKVLDQNKIGHWVLETKISKLTKEEYDKLKADLIELDKKLKYVKNTSIEDMYLNDLKEFKNTIKNDFK